MNRREFSKRILLAGVGAGAGPGLSATAGQVAPDGSFYEEPAKRLPIRRFDLVVAGAGTAAALCAARNCGTRDLPYGALRDALSQGGVYFEA